MKGFYSNSSKFSEKFIKYIKIIILKFKINTIKIQTGVDICCKYFINAHASMIANKQINQYSKNFTDYSTL